MRYSRRLVAAVAATSALVLASCSNTPAQPQSAAAGDITVLTSFYPLQYLTERIGGDLVKVESLTPPGASAHHLELSPAKIAELGNAQAIVFASGFQNAVDEAVEANPPANVIDVAPMVQLLPAIAEEHDHDHDHDHAESGEHHDNDHDHAESADDHDHDHAESADNHDHDHDHAESGEDHDHDHAHEHDHDHGAFDPHFWLDPQRMANAATAIGQALARAFPENAQVFTQNAATVSKEMNELADELVSSTRQCKHKSLVTAHQAFGYLADRAGLTQVGMSDIDPEAAPSPARLAEISKVIKENGVTTVFTEYLIDPKVAETLAQDLGIKTATLDPLENQADASKDYVAVMKENINTLHTALECE